MPCDCELCAQFRLDLLLFPVATIKVRGGQGTIVIFTSFNLVDRFSHFFRSNLESVGFYYKRSRNGMSSRNETCEFCRSVGSVVAGNIVVPGEHVNEEHVFVSKLYDIIGVLDSSCNTG